MRHGTVTIVIGGLVGTIIVGASLGALAASGVALGASLILAFRSNAARAGLRAIKYARLERQIKGGRSTMYGLPDGPVSADQAREGFRDRYWHGRSTHHGSLDAAGLDHDRDGGFRVAGISFDQDTRATERLARSDPPERLDRPWPQHPLFNRLPNHRPQDDFPPIERLRDPERPLPQMIAQRRLQLENERKRDKGD